MADGSGKRRTFGGLDSASLGALLDTVVGHVDQGVSVWDRDLRLVLWNDRYHALLELPEALLAPGVEMRAVAAWMARRGDFGGRDEAELLALARARVHARGRHRVERQLADGSWLQTDWALLPDGGIVVTLTDIGRVKLAEAELAASRDEAVRARAQLVEAIEAISEGFVLWDAEDRLVLFNARYRDEYSFAPDLLKPGVAYEEILREGVRRGVVPAGYSPEDWVAERRSQHLNPTGPYTVQRRDGRWTMITEYRTSEGGIVGIRTDVTRLRASEEEARESRRRLVEAIEALPQGFVIYGPDDRILLFNSAYRRFSLVPEFLRPGLGFEELGREVLRRQLVRPIPADPDAYLADHVARHREGNRRFVDRRRGRWIAVEESRSASGYIVVTHTDISELKERERELKRSRRLMRAVIDAVPAIVNVKNRQSRYVLMNRFQGELYGVDPDDAIGRTSADFTGGGYGAASRRMDQKVLATGQALPWTERDFIDTKGRPHTWFTAKLPLKEEDGRTSHVVTVALDITKLKATERARANLARHVPPSMVETLATADEPFGPPRRQAIGVLFVDMVGFTGLATSRPPEELFALLRAFHAMLARAVDAHGGTLDKFTGDGIMATFGTPVASPRDASNALDCARAIGVAMARDNAARLAAGEPKVRIGVGLHWGEAMMGAIGDERRLEFAVLGDTVNVASRLEGLAHRLSAQICASAEALDAARRQGADVAGFAASGTHALRGRAEPVEVWTFSADAVPVGHEGTR